MYVYPGESTESTLECNVNVTVAGNAVVLVDPLVVDDWFTCAAMHILTSDDVDNLERDSTATVSAKDVYDFEVSASDTEVVELDQVRTTVSVVICRVGAPGRRVMGCGRRHVG